jgi:hypothetical protein
MQKTEGRKEAGKKRTGKKGKQDREAALHSNLSACFGLDL